MTDEERRGVNELIDKLNIKETEIEEFEKENEKLKKRNGELAGQKASLERWLGEAKSLINRLSEYIVLSEDYWKKEDVENQKEILREAEKFLEGK